MYLRVKFASIKKTFQWVLNILNFLGMKIVSLMKSQLKSGSTGLLVIVSSSSISFPVTENTAVLQYFFPMPDCAPENRTPGLLKVP